MFSTNIRNYNIYYVVYLQCLYIWNKFACCLICIAVLLILNIDIGNGHSFLTTCNLFVRQMRKHKTYYASTNAFVNKYLFKENPSWIIIDQVISFLLKLSFPFDQQQRSFPFYTFTVCAHTSSSYNQAEGFSNVEENIPFGTLEITFARENLCTVSSEINPSYMSLAIQELS